MKNTKTNRAKKNSFLAIAVVTAILFCFTACEEDSGGGGGGGGGGGTGVTYTFDSIADFATWLAAQPANTAGKAYSVKLNVSDLGGSASTDGSLGRRLRNNLNKYVNLNLSGNTITSIGEYAFQHCTSLTGVTIPSSVTSIEALAFHNCTSLTGVTIGNSVTSIGYSAFKDCTSLTSVTIPDSVTSIGRYAFEDCTSLTSVTFQGTITSSNFGYVSGLDVYSPFDGDLRTKYLYYGGIGTYKRSGSGTTESPYTWTKQ